MDKNDAFAMQVDEAARTATAIPQLTDAEPALATEDAYRIQNLSVERRVGIKMGLTSRAKMLQVGVSDAILGRLTDAMLLEEGGLVERRSYIHPRAEPEIAFVLRKRLEGRVSVFEALDAIDGIAPAIELIDSRYRDFKFRLADVVADNASSAGFLLGGWHPRSMDVSNLGMVLEVNGEAVEIGSSAAILGSPIRSLVAAARLAAQVGTALEAGEIVLAGAATAAIPLTAGTYVRGLFEQMGTVSFTVQ